MGELAGIKRELRGHSERRRRCGEIINFFLINSEKLKLISNLTRFRLVFYSSSVSLKFLHFLLLSGLRSYEAFLIMSYEKDDKRVASL